MKYVAILLLVLLASCSIATEAKSWIPPGAVIVEHLGKSEGKYEWVVFELRGQLFLYGSHWYDADPVMTRLEEWEGVYR